MLNCKSGRCGSLKSNFPIQSLFLRINFHIWKISKVLWKTVNSYKSISRSFVSSLFFALPVSLIFPTIARGGWFFWSSPVSGPVLGNTVPDQGKIESRLQILKICFLGFGIPYTTCLYILKISVRWSVTASGKLNQHTLVQKLPQILWPGFWPKHSCVLASTCQGLRWPKNNNNNNYR